MENEAIICIERKPGWMDMFRAYKIFLNGKPVGTIRDGMSRYFQIQPGHHELFLTIDWCSSQRMSIDLAPGEKIKIFCQSRNPLFVFYYITLGCTDYIKLSYEPF